MPTDSSVGTGGVAVSVTGVQKAFGATQALGGVDLTLRRGEVHALMGENGSGKSTMVKILSGVHRPDAGELRLGGDTQPSQWLASPRHAIAAGVATVFQEVLVVPRQSVLTNLWLGSDGVYRRTISPQARRARAAEVLKRLIDLPDLDVAVSSLSLSQRQAICIGRALLREPKILILDEATSALDIDTCKRLFEVMRERTAAGVAILLISHRMDEIEAIADHVTVYRSGAHVATKPMSGTNSSEIVSLMTGDEFAGAAAGRRPNRRPSEKVVLLEASGVRLHSRAAPIDVAFRAGEITGLAGLEGHGQDAFLRILAGASPQAGEVRCVSGDEHRRLTSHRDALNRGVVYVPRDRRDESLLESRSILENFALPTARSDRRWGLVSRRQLTARFERYAKDLGIVAGARSQPITSLSGGNQQKVVLARWLATHPNVLLLNDPTRGVDIGAKNDIYRILHAAADDGMAVVVLSTEVIELLQLPDRVLVFRSGDLTRDIPSGELTASKLVGAYFEETA